MTLKSLDKLRKVLVRFFPSDTPDPRVMERFEKLRERRNAFAKTLELKPFRILTNRSLRDLATRMPSSREELGTVFGVGPKTLEKFSDPILQWVKEARGEATM